MKNRKLFRIIISFSAILFLSFGLLSTIRAENIQRGTVSSNNGLNVRSEASLKSKIISVLSSDTPVDLLEQSGDWYKIKIGSTYGYIHKEFVKLDSATESTTPAASTVSSDIINTEAPVKGTVLTEKGLNLREKADATSKTIELLKPGTKVDVLETSNIWCKISVDGYTGYVSKQYLSLQSINSPVVQASANTAASENKSVEGIVLTENGLNLRSEANLKSKIVSILKPNTILDVIEESGDWLKVKADNIEGYAFKQFIKIK